MALVRCPECGREVSERATSCPECGCPLQGGSSGIATLVFNRTGFNTPFQTVRVLDEGGDPMCDNIKALELPKNQKVALKVSVLGPTNVTVAIYEFKSGLFSSSNKLMDKDDCIVEPNHEYLVEVGTGTISIKEI